MEGMRYREGIMGKGTCPNCLLYLLTTKIMRKETRTQQLPLSSTTKYLQVQKNERLISSDNDKSESPINHTTSSPSALTT